MMAFSVNFRSVPVTGSNGLENDGIHDLPPYEDDIEMTEQEEEELLADAPMGTAGTGMEVMTGNPFMGIPTTPQQQEFLEALQEAQE
jgi:hypothetical protein